MSNSQHLPDPETPPGDLDEETFLEAFEAAQRVRADDPDWTLDDDQRTAICNGTGPLHLTAGPGAGKSTVIVGTTLKWLLVDGVPPGGIVVTTFTEKAARSLEQRLDALLGALGYADAISVDELYVGTNHRLWGQIMRDFRFDDYRNVDLLDETAQRLFVARHSDYVDVLADGDAAAFPDLVGNDLRDDGTCAKNVAADVATTLFNRLSQLRVDVDALARSERPAFRRLATAYREYRETLRDHSRCDFARLQERFLDFLDTEAGRRFVQGDPDRDHPPIQRIAVDEYQDVNPLQEAIYFRLAALMPADVPTLTVVGDDDQALYRFRGGTVDCLIEFPERLADALGIDPSAVRSAQLRWNYRSRPEIVTWANRHIGEYPAMRAPGARAPGKEPMRPARDPVDHPSVHLLKEDTKAEAAEAFAEQVERLHANGYVEDLSQIALLAHSTREYWPAWDTTTFVGECVAALEARDIPVYNPRDKGFTQHEEVQAMVAALARCLDPDGQWATDNVTPYNGLGDEFAAWQATLDRVIARTGATDLERFVERTAARVRGGDDSITDWSVIDLFNRLRSLEPFSTWTETDRDPNRTKRLGKLSQLLESFEGLAPGLTENRQLTRTSNPEYDTVSVQFLSQFYWTFCRYLETGGLDDPEDPYESLPAGHVQVMTVHQAKGLEFPVVFVASLDRTVEDVVNVADDGTPVARVADQFEPYTERTPPADVQTRAERDLVRQFYVAHSRAQDSLVLLGTDYYLQPADGTEPVPSLGVDAGVPLTEDWFRPGQRLDGDGTIAPAGATVGAPSTDGVRRTYSIVADVLAFRRCRRQYGYHADYEFAAGSGTQLFAGVAVHQTLDWAHRYYNGDVEEVAGGTPPSRDALREEFDSVVASLRDQRIMPMGREAIDSVFEHVARFNDQIGPDLYPTVVDTECKLRRNAGEFVLTGVADVITDEAGRTALCDYKATARPEDGDSYLADYREQLLVYAGLYAEREGEYPDRAVLYFLADEDPEATRLELTFDEPAVEAAMDRFEETVRELERARETDAWSEIDEADLPDEATCAECDARWDCPYRDYDDR